ncbi:ubiquitin-specific protease ubp2 [Pichia californica]|uniref:ubiquitinyl hydrolase 1 n=1 Tax=Pichia californica TaxID=460514 RepID=A0A9P6WP38_9ASCO|nr:ubiquitin-specific protease ubp2 [[Candida] californica]
MMNDDNDNNNLKLPNVEYPMEDDTDMLTSDPDLKVKTTDIASTSAHPYFNLVNSSPQYQPLDTQIPSQQSHENHQLLPKSINKPIQQSYDFSKAVCMKTSDRILDDLRCDPLFLLKNEEGILSSPTIKYSNSISKMMKMATLKYQPVFWNTNDPMLGSSEMTKLDDNTILQKFSGLLVPNNRSSSDILHSKIYHYSISIKYLNNRANVRNSFYGFLDDDLYEDDKIWIEPKDILEDIESTTTESREIILKSLPQILDSATFISKETGTLVRIEIYPASFEEKYLESFTLTEIQTRIVTYNSQAQNDETFSNININPYDCFIKLKKALTGALTHQDIHDLKSIDLKTTKLQVVIDIQLLLDKFFFTLTENSDSSQLTPIHFASLGEYDFVTRDYFKRAILETVYYIAITSSNRNDFSNYFSYSFEDVFECLKEFDISNQLKNWTNWNDQYYSEHMVLLSICPFYGDQSICHIYELLTSFDSNNTPIYFDALVYCATSRYSEELPYYVTILKGHGVLGFGELKSIFSKLGFNNLSSCSMMNQISDDQLLCAYRNQLIVATTKYEKVTFRENLEKIAIYRSSTALKTYLNTEPFFDIYDAYKLLDIDPSLDDSLMITFYDFKVSENGSSFDPNVARAFYTIVIARKSIVLMSYIDANLPQFSVPDISLQDAYQLLGCMNSADDLLITRIFQERLHKDLGTDFRMLWKSLKTIGEHRKSKLIEGYLTSGIVNSTLLSADQSPAGLNNIGNTCYLNSLLQYYFVIEPLRSYILEFNEVFNKDEFESDEKYQIRRIGGRTVGLKETERSYQFMYQLRDLYYQLIHENDKCVTPSRELAYLAFSPISFEVEFEFEPKSKHEIIDLSQSVEEGKLIDITEAKEEEKEQQENKEEEYSKNLTESSQNEFNDEKKESKLDEIHQDDHSTEKHDSKDNLDAGIDESTSDDSSSVIVDAYKSLPPPVEGKKKTAAVCRISADQFDTAFEIGSQQDVTECISNVLTQIESAMKPDKFEENNEQLDMIKNLFYGKTKQRLVPVDSITKEETEGGNVRTKIESFLNLIVNIGDHPKDIYDALDTFFTEDLLELEDGEVKRSLTISELPNILQIQIQRVQFDRERLIPVKSNDPIPFEEKLYMDRYLETENEVLINKRIEIFHWRRRVEELNQKRKEILRTNEQGMNIRDILKSTKNYLISDTAKELGLPVDMNTLEILDLEVNRLENVLLSINNELDLLHNNITKQFDGFNNVGYSIFAIFIHRGQASYGHYFIYIRDPKSNVFRKYNDETVSEVPIEEVFNFSDGNTSTPYYLSFIKDELLDKITPLERDIFVEQSISKLENEESISDVNLHMDVD